MSKQDDPFKELEQARDDVIRWGPPPSRDRQVLQVWISERMREDAGVMKHGRWFPDEVRDMCIFWGLIVGSIAALLFAAYMILF